MQAIAVKCALCKRETPPERVEKLAPQLRAASRLGFPSTALFRALDEGEVNQKLETEQLSIFLGRNYVLTFQESPGDCFDAVRERIRKGSGRLRLAGPD